MVRTRRTIAAFAAVTVAASSASAVSAQSPLRLSDARAQARRTSPAIAAARASLDAAIGRERQAGAFLNPSILYSREQTSLASQDVAAVEQRLEIGGQRGARVATARLRREAAEARLAAAEAAVDYETARRFAVVLAAGRRAALAARAAEQFRRAVRVLEERLAGGDVSGYEVRRIRLEAARYVALSAQASLEERQAITSLQEILGTVPLAVAPLSRVDATELALAPDSVAAMSLVRSADLRAAALELEAAAADARVLARERVPTPTLTAGFKQEHTDARDAAAGFIAGIALPLPIWDRRAAAVDAAEAEARRVAAELDAARHRVAREARSTLEATQRADEQAAALAAALGAEADAAMHAAEVAYAEGEITLLEWLDAVRAYQEAETAHAVVLAESFIQRAALERLLGSALIR